MGQRRDFGVAAAARAYDGMTKGKVGLPEGDPQRRLQ